MIWWSVQSLRVEKTPRPSNPTCEQSPPCLSFKCNVKKSQIPTSQWQNFLMCDCSVPEVQQGLERLVESRLWFSSILPGSNYLLFPLCCFGVVLGFFSLCFVFVSSQPAWERMWVRNKRCRGFNLARQKKKYSFQMLKQAEREVWGLVWKDRTLFPVLFPAVMGDTQILSWGICPPNLLYSIINIHIHMVQFTGQLAVTWRRA